MKLYASWKLKQINSFPSY